jgi:putative ABC transport system permease protein
MKLHTIAARNILRNRRRSILSGVAIAVAAMTMTFMFSIVEGLKVDMRGTTFRYYTGQVRVRNAEYDANELLNPLGFSIGSYLTLTEAIEALPETAAVSPRISFRTGIYENDTTYPAMGLGVDFKRETGYQDLAGTVTEGRLPENGENGVLVAAGLAEDMKVSPGDKITLFAQTRGRGSNAMTFTVTGIARFPAQGLNNGFFIAPLDRVQRLLRMDGEVTEILVMFKDGVNDRKAADTVRGTVSRLGLESVTAQHWTEIGDVFSILQLAEVSYSFVALFFFLLGSTVVINTTIMVIYERIREIGTISALGMTGGEIIRLFFLESFFIAVLGSLAGVLLGSAISAVTGVTGLDFSSAMEGVSIEMSPVMYPVLNLRSTVFVFLYSVAISSLASLFPSRRASRVEPVEALRAV